MTMTIVIYIAYVDDNTHQPFGVVCSLYLKIVVVHRSSVYFLTAFLHFVFTVWDTKFIGSLLLVHPQPWV